jgi:glycosyltransferase involved in cell wall biosynthesis
MFKAIPLLLFRMNSDLPAYLKSLEAIIGGANVPVPAPSPAPAPVPTPTPVDTTAPTSFTFTTASPTNSVTTVVTPPTGTQKKLKFLMVSTHAHQFTGYSKVSYHTLQLLSKIPWLTTIHYGFQKMQHVPPGFRPYPSNIEVIDAVATEQPGQPGNQGFGFAALPDIIRKKQPNVVMIYNDMSIVTKFLEEIRKSGVPRNFKIWVYCDQVYNTQLQGYLDVLNRDADIVFAFTPFWKKCLKDQGITRPLEVLGHGFDPKQFFSLPKEVVRKQIGLPNEAFLLLNLNRNQPRKRYDILLMAFVELLVKYPTKPIFLMCVCDKGEKGGWWLFEIFQRELKLRGVPIEQFGNRLMISSQDMIFKDEDVNMFYNVADVGISTAEGEGWGLCQFEQMGVGIPQVVPDIGGFKDFANTDNSMIVKPKYRYYLPSVYSPVGGEAQVCDPHDVCLAIEEYLLDSEKRASHGKKAKETVLNYTWEKATSRLIKRLEDERDEMD